MEPLTPEQYASDAVRYLMAALDAMEGLASLPINRSRELSLARTNAEQAQMWLDKAPWTGGTA